MPDSLLAERPNCVRFSCCSPIASTPAATRSLHPLQLLLPDCVHFSYCSPLASTSAVAPRLRPLQLLPDCVRFNCCFPIAPLRLLLSSPCPMFLNILQSSRFSKLKYEGHASLVYSSPAPLPSRTHTHTHTPVKI